MKRKSLAYKVSLYVFTIMVIFLVGIGGFYYAMASQIIVDMTEKNTKQVLDRVNHDLSSYLERLRQSTYALSNNESIRSYMLHETTENKNTSLEIIHTFLKTDSQFLSIVLITKDGRVLSNLDSMDMSLSKNMMEEEWYTEAIKQKGVAVLTSMKRKQDNKEIQVISMTQDIHDEKGENIGVLRMDVSSDSIDDYLQQLNLQDNGELFIVDQTNRILYQSANQTEEVRHNLSEIMRIKETEMGYMNGQYTYVQSNKLGKSTWELVAVVPLSELKDVQLHLLVAFSLSGIFIFVVTGGVLLILIRKWTRPLKELQQTMHQIEHGDYSARAVIQGSEEVQDLSLYFNRMLDEINRLLEGIKEKERDIRYFELQALTSQINPHFLYNTLDTIIWMAEFNDSQKVVSMTKALAQFFRLSLNAGNELMTLENEFDHIRQYLFIQKQRYEEQLEYEITLLEKCKDIKVPRLILQPIVENAIYHGIKGLDRKGMIRVFMTETDTHYGITIEDNGRGIKQTTKDMTSHKRLGGVGLQNVDERLRLYYGQPYKMDIVSQENTYTAITLWLPKNQNL
ncbi:HAMP domain-containing protein [Granulicatella sp. zg-ZJ]|uniref:cache domain-containing sensor histidine kinase n=1 Tax=Granulicatella sp. zg-ZJ TaxID=2678504 RepID=UPI0013D24EE2|nr:sensor histidine kinase [Granulicatella sp. zg-ZJ]NEW62836.1 HAMP domain-containing protein [Granulicatella sp. zg-ZJ]